MSGGDRARGDWTPWPIVPGQLEIPLEDHDPVRAEEARRREYDFEEES